MNEFITVRVARESSGQVYSEVYDRATMDPLRSDYRGLVVDRAKGRQFDVSTVITRAKLLADMLRVPYEEDLQWPCAADRKLPCKCPKCIEAGRV